MPLQTAPFGTLDGGPHVEEFTLDNHAGLVLTCINYGARITRLRMPDRDGAPGDIVLGFEHLEPYIDDKLYFGPACGRYANRLAHGRFTLDGVEYQTPLNDPSGPNTLHGGPRGFDKKLWSAEPRDGGGVPSVRFTLVSPHMDEGFPGEMNVSVTYTLMQANDLRIDYEARTDRPTIVNLTNHIYFNLAGAGGTVLDHVVHLHADRYAPTSDQFIPSGQIVPVNRALDLTSPRRIGEGVRHLKEGYDHTYAPAGLGLRAVAELTHAPSGREMIVESDQPALQFYTSGQLKGDRAGIGGRYDKFAGVVFEPMHFPDSPHHAAFPSTVLRAGEMFRSSTVYRFRIIS